MIHDLRYAIRQLLRTPGFTIAAVVTLALGIGATTAFYAAVNALIYRPFRVASFDNLFILNLRLKQESALRGAGGYGALRLAWIRQLEQDTPAGVEAVAAMSSAHVLAHIPGRADRVGVELILGDYRGLLRLTPQAGRFITRDDEVSAARVVVISDRLWRDWFDADPAIVGRTSITVRDQQFEVIGVAPLGYHGLSTMNAFGTVDLWMPLETWNRRIGDEPDRRSALPLVRLAPGAIRAEVSAQAHAILTRAPSPDAELRRVDLWPLGGGGPYDRTGRVIIGLAALVLLAACANLANMLYARGAGRAAEIAVRRSLGATATRIFRLLLIETALIALAASIIGLAFALGATALLQKSVPSVQARAGSLAINLAPDYRVFVFAFVTGIGSAFFVGLTAAFRASRVPPQRALAAADASTSISKASRRTRLGLVAMQVTAAVILLTGASAFIQQTTLTLEDRVTFDTRPLATARIDLSQHGYTNSRAVAFANELVRRVAALPELESAALTDGMPGGSYLSGAGAMFAAEIVTPGQPEARWISVRNPRANGTLISASSRFLPTIGVAIAEGRNLTDGDRAGAPLVAIVSRSLAAKLWPAGSALGKRMMIGNEGGWRTIVGICDDPVGVKTVQPPYPGSHMVVVPLEQRYQPGVVKDVNDRALRSHLRDLIIVVRSARSESHIRQVQEIARAIDEKVAMFDGATVDASILAWMAPLRASRILTSTLALTALLIAGLGIYGVLAFLVSRRTREFGIRMALGAQRRQIVKMVFDEALNLMLIGLLVGVFLGAVSERLINYRTFAGMLRPNELSTWMAVPLLLLVVGLLAAVVPARRAASVDPNVALRDL